MERLLAPVFKQRVVCDRITHRIHPGRTGNVQENALLAARQTVLKNRK